MGWKNTWLNIDTVCIVTRYIRIWIPCMCVYCVQLGNQLWYLFFFWCALCRWLHVQRVCSTSSILYTSNGNNSSFTRSNTLVRMSFVMTVPLFPSLFCYFSFHLVCMLWAIFNIKMNIFFSSCCCWFCEVSLSLRFSFFTKTYFFFITNKIHKKSKNTKLKRMKKEKKEEAQKEEECSSTTYMYMSTYIVESHVLSYVEHSEF